MMPERRLPLDNEEKNEEKKVKETKTFNVKGKRILLESNDNHRMSLDVYETGELVLHELFGVPGSQPDSLAELSEQVETCYHVTICIKAKYVPYLLDMLKRDDLFTFPEPPAQDG